MCKIVAAVYFVQCNFSLSRGGRGIDLLVSERSIVFKFPRLALLRIVHRIDVNIAQCTEVVGTMKVMQVSG